MFQVCRAKCFRCARQDVSGVSGKFRVCRARCFRCAGQDVSGVPGKMFQVTTDKMFQVRRVRCFRCAGHVLRRARGGRYAARCFRLNSKQWFTTYFLQEAGAGKRCSGCGFRCVGQRLQHEPLDHIPVTVCCAESGRTLGGDCLSGYTSQGEMVGMKINYSKGHLGVDNRRPYSSDQRNRNKSKIERADYIITNQETALSVLD